MRQVHPGRRGFVCGLSTCAYVEFLTWMHNDMPAVNLTKAQLHVARAWLLGLDLAEGEHLPHSAHWDLLWYTNMFRQRHATKGRNI